MRKSWSQVLEETFEALTRGAEPPDNALRRFERHSFDETFYIPRPARTAFMQMLHSMIVKNTLQVMTSVARLDLSDYNTEAPVHEKSLAILTPAIRSTTFGPSDSKKDWLQKAYTRFVKLWRIDIKSNKKQMDELKNVLEIVYDIYTSPNKGMFLFFDSV
jgi:hypothetical protein